MSIKELRESLQRGKLSTGEVISSTWKFYSKFFTKYLPLILFGSIPCGLLVSFFPGNWFALITSTILSSLVGIFIISYTHQLVFEGRTSESTDTSASNLLGYLLPALWVGILSGILIMLATLLLIIPGIIVGVYLTFVLHSVILRGKRGMDALDYSYRLIEDRWWEVFLTMLCFGLIVIIPTFLVQYLAIYITPYIVPVLQPFISTYSAIGTTLLFLSFDPSSPMADPFDEMDANVEVEDLKLSA